MRSLFNFAKQVLAATLGVTLFAFIFFSLVYNIVSYKIAKNFQDRTEVIMKENAILRIKLSGEVVEHILDTPSREQLISLSELNAVLEQAADDPNIQGIFIEIGDISGGLDSLDALRQAFEKFKKTSELPIVVYSSEYNEALLAFSSIADHKILHPSGHVLFNGLSIKRLFYKRLLERFDVEAMFFRAGKYKVSSMPYIMDHMTEQDKVQWLKIMRTKHDFLIEKITSNKKIKVSDLNNILQNQPLLSPEEALAYHLIDVIGFADKADIFFNQYLEKENTLVFQDSTNQISTAEGKAPGDNSTTQQTQGEGDSEESYDPDDAPNYIVYDAYKRILQTTYLKGFYGFAGSKVGILPLAGDIVSKDTEPRTISEEAVLPLLKQYAEDDSIKVIVVIMDSPGGYSIPTATIGHEIERIKKHKPVICLVRNGALSGGLHIAVSCTKIIAVSPGTPIGSIGVWSMGFNFQEAASKHLSVDADGVKTHEYAELYKNNLHKYTEREKAFIQKSVEQDYKRFKAHVRRCRNLTEDEIEAAAEGRIFTAKEALKLKLIDEIAPSQSLQRAIDLGLELAGIDKDDEEIQVVYPVRRIDMKGYLSYFIRGIINNKGLYKHSQQGKTMYHAGYDLRQEGQCA